MMPALRPPRHPSLDLKPLIRDIPDFPKPGILFRDITPLLRDPQGWRAVMTKMGEICQQLQPDLIVGIESRGFIVGTALATDLGIGFVPVRKPGKLPGAVIGVDYALEYGSDRLEIDPGAIDADDKVALVDDLIATGGTALAATQLVRMTSADVATALFVVDLPDLGGATRLRNAGISVTSLLSFEGD